MKKNQAYLVLGLLLMGIISSCEDYLEVVPESSLGIDQFYSDEVEAEIALSGIYSVFANDDVYGQVMSVIMESGTDEGFYNRRFNENWTVGLYRHTAADGFVERLWASLYEAVNLSNLFIAQLQEDQFEPAEYKRLIAEARFLRAHAFQLLASRYEEIPLRLTPTTNLSSGDLAPSSLEEVYAQIESDFLFAAENLRNITDEGYVQGRANAMAARGLLARSYLKRAGYPLFDTQGYALAREQCLIIMNSGIHSLNASDTTTEIIDGEERIVVTNDGYRNHFLSYIQNFYDSNESMFEISFGFLRDSGLTTDGRLGAINGVRFAFGGGAIGTPFAFAGENTSNILRDSYLSNNDSIRRVWNVPQFTYTGSGDAQRVDNTLSRNFNPGKFRRWEPANLNDLEPGVSPSPGSSEPFILLEDNANANPNFTGINFPVLRYADVLLMFAEADNNVNGAPTAMAINALDQVRARAGVAPISDAKPNAIASQESFFNELVDERLRELCFEGLRKHDLIRWELLDDKLALLQERIIGDPNYSPTNADHLAYQRSSMFFDISRHLSLPYPLTEVNLNPSLNQKPEWQ